MTRAVLLRHGLPDGSAHLDWLIERATPGVDRRLVAFRLALADGAWVLGQGAGTGGDGGVDGGVEAERLTDHRGVYLDHEGPIVGGRGDVSRLAAGVGRIVSEAQDRVGFECSLGHGPRRYEAWAMGGGRWRIVALPDTRPSP